MTLTEYSTQSQIKRTPTGSVFLEPGEFQIVGKVNELTAIFISSYNYTYVKIEGKTTLYTMDEHGNPKSQSVFAIK